MKELRKYFIMGSQDCPVNREPEDILKAAILGGVTAFQYREKGANALTGMEKFALGKRLRDICAAHQLPFIVNDDPALAIALDADGIHVGQADRPVDELRELFPDAFIGLSISNAVELAKSEALLPFVDYIGAGPVFPTTSKADAKKVAGLAWIKALHEILPQKPIVGIGGINGDNAAAVRRAGADGVAVISAITKADNIKAAVSSL